MISFKETGLNEYLLRAINELGFDTPTAIQERTIPHLIESNKDLIALAQTGTGKTAAFGLPIINGTDETSKKIQALVLCPTRELCLQITGDLRAYSKYTPGFMLTAVYGGASIDTQIRALKKGNQIVVATPGRALDLLKRKRLILSDVNWLVLDEADEMLTMGFKTELDAILEALPEERQTLLFSATMSSEIREISKKYMKKPEEITVGQKNTGAENVSHYYYMTRQSDRYEALKRIADINPDIYGIVFCRTRNETKEVAEKLIRDGYNADALHGDLSQAQRDQVMNRFRSRHLQILVATDVAARGLDVDDITLIINYSLPDENGIYIHRSGRTGRAGKSGKSVSIIFNREQYKIRKLEKIVGKKFVQKMVPGGREICEKQLFNLINRVELVEVNESQIETFIPSILKKLSWLDREKLIKHFVSVEFNRFLAYYKDARDLNYKDEFSREDKKGRKKKQLSYTRFYFNVGSKQNFDATRIIGTINDHLPDLKVKIGKIEIMKKFSFVEIDSNYKDDIIRAFDDTSIIVEVVKKPLKDSKEKQGRSKDKSSYGRSAGSRPAGKRKERRTSGRKRKKK